MAFKDVPDLTQELIDNLKDRYPLEVPKVTDSIAVINRQAGWQECITWLQEHLDEINRRTGDQS